MPEEKKEKSSESPEDLIRIKIPKEYIIEAYVIRTEDGELVVRTKEELERIQREVKEKKEQEGK